MEFWALVVGIAFLIVLGLLLDPSFGPHKHGHREKRHPKREFVHKKLPQNQLVRFLRQLGRFLSAFPSVVASPDLQLRVMFGNGKSKQFAVSCIAVLDDVLEINSAINTVYLRIDSIVSLQLVNGAGPLFASPLPETPECVQKNACPSAQHRFAQDILAFLAKNPTQIDGQMDFVLQDGTTVSVDLTGHLQSGVSLTTDGKQLILSNGTQTTNVTLGAIALMILSLPTAPSVSLQVGPECQCGRDCGTMRQALVQLAETSGGIGNVNGIALSNHLLASQRIARDEFVFVQPNGTNPGSVWVASALFPCNVYESLTSL